MTDEVKTSTKRGRGRPKKQPESTPTAIEEAKQESLKVKAENEVAEKEKAEAGSKTDNVITKAPKNPEMITVETTGQFGLTDPITGSYIPHDKSVEVPKNSPFTVKMIELGKLKEV